MRTLKLRFPDDALPTLDTFVKHTKDARVFRRAQAVRNVVKGQRLQTVSDTLQFTYSALRKWVYRFAHQGTQGLVDRPRSGRPPKVTCELERYLNHLVDQDPLEHGRVIQFSNLIPMRVNARSGWAATRRHAAAMLE
jgi:transposase